MATTTTNSPSVKKYVDYAQQQVDEQAILDKYNAATTAQYNLQREQNRAAENQFYNQMYNTQRTAMDTIRQSNAAAVASGASRGVQAANELAAILGLQQESVQGATEIAQANRQTAQEETAAVLENVLNAYNQATQERAQLVQQGIESASVDVQQQANQIAAQEAAVKQQDAQTNRATLITSAAENGSATYLTSLGMAGIDFSDGNVTVESTQSLNVALGGVAIGRDGNSLAYKFEDWKGDNTGAAKGEVIMDNLKTIISSYGLDPDAYTALLEDYAKVAREGDVDGMGAADSSDRIFNKYNVIPDGNRINGREEYAGAMNNFTAYIKNKIYNDYINGLNRKAK